MGTFPTSLSEISPELWLVGISTINSSVWLWTFLTGSFALRAAATPWMFLRDKFLNIEGKPLLALGWIGSMLILLTFVLLAPFFVG